MAGSSSSPPNSISTSPSVTSLKYVETDGDQWEPEFEYESDSNSEITFTGDEVRSSASSQFSFTYDNGRRYHSDRFKSEYYLPNDECEQDRLDLYHHIFLSLLGGALYISPLQNPKKILDVGTGTGIWAMDIADEHPEAEVVGTDLSPIQPPWVPPNCRFEVEDMEEDWPYAPNYFDFIHIRSLSGSFQDWDQVLLKAHSHLEPGGYLEYQDYAGEIFYHDGTRPPDDDIEKSAFAYYLKVVNDASIKRKRPFKVAQTMKARFENLGLENVKEHRAVWPLGDWPKDPKLKELGRWGRIGAIDSIAPFAVGYLRREGWTHEEIAELCSKVRKDIGRGGSKYYCEGWFICGRKPNPRN